MVVLTVIISLVVVVLTCVLAYVKYMSRDFNMFKEMGIPGPTPKMLFGNFKDIVNEGYINFNLRMYQKYKNEKVYGIYEPGRPLLFIRDLDMIRDISIKHFNSFVNRRVFFNAEPFDTPMNVIKDGQWRRVRNFVSPTFSSGKLKRMSKHVEEATKTLRSNLRHACHKDTEVELSDVIYAFTMDVIASTGFGVKTDTMRDKKHPFVVEANKILNGFNNKFIALMLFCPTLANLLLKMGLGGFPVESAKFFHNFVDEAIANRNQDESSGNRHDFLQLMINAEESSADGSSEMDADKNAGVDERGKGLSRKEIQGQAFIFITASYENLTKVISFTLFLLAHHPECRKKVQEELDAVLHGRFPSYEDLQELTYLDMCVNETMRLYPPGYQFDRECNEECTVHGIRIPKGIHVVFPAMAIHRDPALWPEPEKFDPERFSPEQKANRHLCAHIPFGQGPRNCVGMRLAMVQVKTALASILQFMSPIPCEKSVYPITLLKHQPRAEHGMWVKFVLRVHDEEQ